MIKEIAVCGLRYGKTKYQAEQMKKYIEENNFKKVNITILDSESKKKIDKLREYICDRKFKPEEYSEDEFLMLRDEEIKEILQILDGSDE